MTNKTQAAAPADDSKHGSQLVIPNANAIAAAKHVGAEVLGYLNDAAKDEQKAHALMANVDNRKRESIAKMTMAIAAVADADTTVDLLASLSGEVSKQNILNDALRVALGIMEVETLPHDAGIRLVYSEQASRFMPPVGKGVNRDTADYKRKVSIRNNFATLMKSATQAAIAIRDMKATVVLHESGTLQLSGPGVVKAVGSDKVMLDGTKSDENKLPGGKATFKALQELAKKTHKGVSSAAKTGAPQAAAVKISLGEVCNSLIAVIRQKEGVFSEDDRKHLLSVTTAIEGALSAPAKAA